MRKKILTILALLFLVLLLGGGYLVYQFLTPDQAVEQELNEQFSKEFFSFDDILNDRKRPPTTNEENNDGEQTDDNGQQPSETNETSSNNQEPSNQGSTSNPGPSQNQPSTGGGSSQDEPVTEQAIVDSYVPTFTALEQSATGKLNDLFDSGYAEYTQKKEDGTLNLVALSKKYMQAAQTLENNLDQTFYALLGEMEEELADNNLPTTEVNRIEQEYQDKISSLKSEFMSKLR
ncbi:hypothetical protein [Bacillus horti]|uniref:Cytoskeletal protein RodZ n=1 Tax=Caldalkalibacillus horti TaxID=77523 RepID=A0ABT9W5Q2_9BACI|nr:hypothetical protein [Bacillus horti]MDQ0168455.1 cytoskeletal protein RodZ [Bacillus horti]